MRRLTLPILAFLSIISPARADWFKLQPQTPDPNSIVTSLGMFNSFDGESSQRPSEIRFELRMNEFPIWHFHPWAGIEAVSEIGPVGWYGGGLETDIDLWSDKLVLNLQTGMGYFDDGHQPVPGWQYLPKSGFDFRHTAELGYRIGDQGWRVGLGISHMSNGGISGGNTSTQTYTLAVHMPIDKISKN